MLITKHTQETSATPNQIWQILQDVENWKNWDHGTESSSLDAPFQTGTRGTLKPKEGPLLKTLLTHVEPQKMFVQEANLFFAKTIMTHTITKTPSKTFVTFQNEITGPLALLYMYLIGPSIKRKIPIEMEAMLKQAEAL